MFLISVADSLGDLEATKARLLENPRDIANVFRRYYGNNFANNIQKLLTEHLVIGGDLIVASNEVSARLKKDYTADIKAYDLVQKEALQMAMFFVDGIVRQFADLF